MTDYKMRENIEKVRDWHMEGASSSSLSKKQEKQLKLAFKIFDKEVDGEIDKHEYQVRIHQV